MKTHVPRSAFVTIVHGTVLLAVIGSTSLARGAHPSEASERSVKDLKLKVSPNGRYFVDGDGTPVFWLGTTQWNLFREFKLEEGRTILEKSKSHGFTFAQVMLLGVGDGTKANVYGEKPWTSFDPLTPNEAYFHRVDALLSIARENNVVISLTLYHQRWRQIITERNARTWAKWLAQRYKDVSHLVWSMTPEAKQEFVPVLRELAAGLKEGDGGSHLITFKPDPAPYSSSFIHGESWLDFDSMQTWKSVELIYPMVTHDYNLNPVKPVLMAEGAYEHGSEYGFDVTPLWVRRQAYYSYLAGAHYTYGHNDSWRVLPTWKEALDAPGAVQMGILRKVFEARKEWWNLVPDQSVLASGGKTDGHLLNLAARHKDGKWLMVYLADRATFSIDCSKFTGAPQASAFWIDPRTGESSSIGKVPNRGVREFTTPEGWEDALLILEPSDVSADDAKAATGQPLIRGPLRASKNPNYFEDASGVPLILCGSHSWNTLQDWGTDGVVRPLDFGAFVTFLKRHGHNFTLLWYSELPTLRGLPSTQTNPPDFTVSPHPWARTGPGNATDGRLKFDLTKFDQAYFDRLRARVEALNRAGIYVGVYLFTGEFPLRFRFSSDGYPFSGPNNVNGVDDGYRGGSPESGLASVTMRAPNAMTEIQDAYVRKTIDTLNDLPNVLWIVSEEAPKNSIWWNSHLISVIRTYEKGKRYQHPVGYAMPAEPPDDSIVYNSDADWVAPTARVSPEKSCGTGIPSCKVNVNDSDHSYFGLWNDSPQTNRNYVWENFIRGNQILFMDPYLVYYPRQKRNRCVDPVKGIGREPDARYENLRSNLGYILAYSRKLDLGKVGPQSALCSTKFCLAQTPATGAEYLVYAPAGGPFTVDLSAMSKSRTLAGEWFNPATGQTTSQAPIAAGSSAQSFEPPFSGDAVLYLVDATGHR